MSDHSHLAVKADSDLLTLPEALAAFPNLSRWLIFEWLKAKKLAPHKTPMPSPRQRSGYTNHTITQPRRLLSRTELEQLLAERDAVREDGDRLILPSEAEEVYKFDVSTMLYWEDHKNPYSKKTLTIEYAPIRFDQSRKDGVTVHNRRESVKHYIRAEIKAIYLESKKPSNRGIYVDADGATWLTQRHAQQRHGTYNQALEAWRRKGWLAGIQRPRDGSGSRRKWWYYREDDETKGKGILQLVPLQKGPNKRILADDVRAMQETVQRAAQARKNAGGLNGQKPRWDEESRKLWLGDVLLKSFDRQPAKNQIDLIEAFHREEWPETVCDPFRDSDKLYLVCKKLNRSIPSGTIRFGRDGTGEGARWARA